MNRVICTLLGAWAAALLMAQPSYQKADSVFICRLLADAQRQPATACLPLYFANQFLGRPYVAHTLERFDEERLIVNTRELDCTTLVENVAALTLCARQRQTSFADFLRVLCQLRYRGGAIDGYPSRLHYFSDWIDDKRAMQLVKEIQGPNPPFTAIQQLNIHYMSRHPQAYKALKAHPELVPLIRRQEQALTGRTYRYVPKSAVKNTQLLRSTIKDGDIIAITCNKDGLDIAHLGLAVWRKDGLHLLNASQLHKKVVLEPMTFYQYLQRHPSHTGIRVVRIL